MRIITRMEMPCVTMGQSMSFPQQAISGAVSSMLLRLPLKDSLLDTKHRLLAKWGWALEVDLLTCSTEQLLGTARIACLSEADLYYLPKSEGLDRELSRRNEDAALSLLQRSLPAGLHSVPTT